MDRPQAEKEQRQSQTDKLDLAAGLRGTKQHSMDVGALSRGAEISWNELVKRRQVGVNVGQDGQEYPVGK